MGMGQAAAVTAALSIEKGVTPAKVPVGLVKKTLRDHGAIVPG